MVRKIAIVGPESTGKSTISMQLARHYQTRWVPEYARYYCAALVEPCTVQDEINMFHGQLALEDACLAVADQPLIICDTTILTVKIWCDAMLGATPVLVLDTLAQRPYDHYLLMDIDLPWEDDVLRDFPHQREYFMDVWHRELQSLQASYTVINGKEDRLQNAIAAIDTFMEKQ